MAGPLEGLTVVDATWGMPGAVAGLLFADLGARVVKVERTGADPGSPLRRSLDRGKWSVELDLGTPDGVRALTRLLSGADVFVESFGVGRADDLRLGRAALRASHPALVHCSLTAYGQDGPWRDRPGYDALIAARFGATAEQLGHREGPTFLGHPSISYCTGLVAAISMIGALRARTVTGRGQFVDASLLDGLLAQSPMNWWWNEAELSYLARTGDTKGFGRTRLITDPFRCQDGEYLMMHTGGAGSFKRALDLLGVGEKIREIPGVEMAEPLNDEEYHVARNVVPGAFAAKTRAEWLELFHANDIAALPVMKPGEAFADDQVQHAGLEIEVDDPELGTLRQVGPVAYYGRSPTGIPRGAPRVGAHNDRLSELSARRVSLSSRGELRHPLDGIRVLDFSSFFATAYGAKLLADLGADVIKIESPGGDQMRPAPDPFEACQRGKRNLCIDLRSPEALEVVHDLVRRSDVVMQNLRPGKAEKLGIGVEQLTALNPDLIYCYLPGFGSSGPKSKLKSFAPLISGLTGILYEASGEGNPPIPRAMCNEDYYNGFMGALSTLAALYHRDVTGEGQYVEVPQLNACLFASTHTVLDPSGVALPAFTLDHEQLGYGPLYRIYHTADGAICLTCVGDRAFARLSAALDLDCSASDPGLASTLEGRFKTLTAEAAFGLLDRSGVPCEVVAPEPFMPDFLWDEWAFETDRVFEHQHDKFGLIREIGLVTHLSDTPGAKQGPGALLGEHTRDILTELGYGEDRITALLGSVCHQHE